MVGAGTAGAATFTVNSADDVNDGTCTPSPGHCSLREAINAANADGTLDTIAFAVGVGAFTIQPTSQLPTISQPVLLDGWTQAGWDDGSPPLVELDGSVAGSAHGLAIGTSGSTVRGFVINGFATSTRGGIYLANGASSNVVVGNWIGTNAAGTAADANHRGILVDGQDNTVGGTADPDERNVVSGNTLDGIEFGPNALGTATGNVVRGNYLGLNAAGTAAVANGGNGVSDNGVGSQTITGNVISGNAAAGVNAFSNTVVTGNLVGTNAAGTAAVANQRGINARSNANTIGGTTAAQRNVVSGNTLAGIDLSGDGNTVRGNYVGPNLAGTASIPNGTGIEIGSSSNTIGGTASGDGNVVSGNGTGVLIDASLGEGVTGNVVAGNLIGVAPNGVSGMGNTGAAGVLISASGNTVGGTAAGAANEIAYNTGDGVGISSGTATAVNRNKIHTNGQLGIDLGPNGVTANDAGDGDSGANNLQNFPVISTVHNGQISGTLSSAASSQYELDFFQSAACDPSGNGEGAGYLGSLVVTTGSDGNVSFTSAPPLIGVGQWVTATATDEAGNTSELSACVQATAATALVVNSTGDPGDGSCDATECTLREAINAANANVATADTIEFDIPNPGVQTIVVSTPLPVITGPVTIDGTTQGDPALHLIELSGDYTVPNGLLVTGSSVTVRGLIVHGFDEAGVRLDAPGNTVEGNWLGLNALGAAGDGQQNNGVSLAVNADGNTIRGNAIGGNNVAGIHMDTNGIDGVDGTVITGNLIGTNAAGTGVASNGYGVIVAGAANEIGGPEQPADANVIAGNSIDGVLITDGVDNRVQGNRIGVNASGTQDIGNGGNGVNVTGGESAQVGGSSAGRRNVIAASGSYGISVGGTSVETTIRGNVVGAHAPEPNCVITQPASIEGVTATNITFVNDTDVPVSIYWLDYTGNRVGYRPGVSGPTPLAAGDSYTQPTWLTHPWVAVDPEGTCLGYTISDVASKTYVIEKEPELANVAGGILVDGAPDTEIGGTSPGDGNVVSGNFVHGIRVIGSGATGTRVQGNFIGTDTTGTQDVGNQREGVRVETGPATIGGAGEIDGTRNVISGNDGFGVLVYGASGVVVQNNYVGTDVTGMEDLGNGWDGIGVDGGSANLIGGTEERAGNVVSGNEGQGIAVFAVDFESTTGNTVQGNTIGWTAGSEPDDLGNDGDGIRLHNATGTTVGGTVPEAANVVGNNDHGVALRTAGTTDNIVAGNEITDSIQSGVLVDGATENKIGPGNTIVDNGVSATGVRILSGDRNTVTENSIDDNLGLGIDLGASGVTPNDVEDSFQDFPVLDTATSSGSLAVTGELPNIFESGDYRLEFFRSDTCDASGHGEGATFLGYLDVSDGGSGVPIPFTFVLEGDAPLGDFVTATATDSIGNTSEFSACEQIVEGGEPPTANVTLSSTTATEEAGAAQVQLEDVPFTAILDAARRSNTAAAPVNELPVNELPVNELPVNELPVNELGFLELPHLLRAVPLSSIPLLRPGGWEAFLSTTTLRDVPLTNVTLRDVLTLTPLPPGLDPAAPNDIRLSEIDFSRSPLGQLSATVLVLGDETKLAELPIEGGDAAWCEIFSGPPINCTSAGQITGSSLLELSLRGAPVNELPVNELPVNELPVNELPVNELPVNELNVAASPVNELPVNELPVNELPVNELPVNELLAAGSPVNELPVNELTNRDQIVNCNVAGACDQGKTLADAFAAGALRPGVTFGDIRADVLRLDPDFSFGDLRYYGDITLGELLAAIDAMSPPADPPITLGDIYAMLFTPNAVRWERLDLEAMQITQFATNGSIVDYRADFFLTGGGAGTSAVEIGVELPAGFLYVPGTSRFVQVDPAGPTTPLADPVIAGQRLTWTASASVGIDYRIEFQARPGLSLGPVQATAAATPVGGDTTGSTPSNLEVGDTLEPNPLSAPREISDDSFYLSYITSKDDVDYYAIDVPTAGARTTVRLSHVPPGADYDLVVYGPVRPPLRTAVPGTPPLDEKEPLLDEGAQLTHRTDSLGPQVLMDVPLADLPVVGVSVNREQEDEAVLVLSSGLGGRYTIQVSGYNGTTSVRPYMLRVSTEPPRVQPACVPRAPLGAPGAAGASTALPAGLNTVFVVNAQQLQRLYGPDGRATVINTLNSNLNAMSNLGFPSAILSVDASLGGLYDAWNACPSDPNRANDIVRAIGGLLDGIRQQRPTLKYVVLVGGDDVVPQARLGDFTTVANEFGYADTFPTGTALFGSLYNSQVLTDDPYADVDPIPYLDRQLHLPDLVPGRLVETPQQIADALTRFVAPATAGRLDPQTALTTGYDFIRDGAGQIDGIFKNKYGAANSPSLISDDWTRSQLVGLLGAAPGLASINGHADHDELLPAAGNTAADNSDNVTTGDLPATLAGRTIFSVGCHFGLSVNDVVVAGNSTDWAQAAAARGAQLLGNTGFGYGDTIVVAYSEELSRQFAQNIVSGAMTAGEAVVNAKQEYFASRGVFSVYDEKSMIELTLYGMPMYAVGPAGAPPAPPSGAGAGPVITDGATGLAATTFAVDPTTTEQTDPGGRGKYFVGPGGVQVSHWRPLQPKQFVSLEATDHHGVLLTELTSDDVAIEPVYARPTFDDADNEPEAPFGEVIFPTKINSLRTYKPSFGTLGQRLVLVTGQFFSDETPDAAGAGVQRLFRHIAGRVFKSPSTDFAGPVFTRVDARNVGGSIAVTVDVTDPGGGPVRLVTAAVLDGNNPVWKFFTLAETTPGRFTGGIPITSQNAGLLVQAVDAAGNVESTWNKGLLYETAPSPPADTGGLALIPNVSPGPSGWYSGAVTLTVQKPADVLVEVSVDGGAFDTAGASITVSGDGVHTVVLRGSNGGTASETVPIDGTAPTITIGTPAAGAQYAIGSRVLADYRCSDAGSGVVGACTGTVPNGSPIDTSSLGTKTFTVNGVSDAAGNSTPAKTVTYTVVERRIVFASSRTGNGDIYSMNPNGSGLTRLTATSWIEAEPVLSPDGSRIAFTSTRDGNLELYVMNADGTGLTRLTNAPGIDTSAAWSPNGQKLAFSSQRMGGDTADIFVMNADGTGPTRLTADPKDDLFPTWSPDGGKIAFTAYRSGKADIYSMNANGSNLVRLTDHPEFDLEPAWSPDGTKIAFSSSRHGASNFEIIVMNANGSSQVRLTNNREFDGQPAWSRSGGRIAFVSARDRNLEIYSMNPNGSGQTRLTNHSAIDAFPGW